MSWRHYRLLTSVTVAHFELLILSNRLARDGPILARLRIETLAGNRLPSGRLLAQRTSS